MTSQSLLQLGEDVKFYFLRPERQKLETELDGELHG